MPFFLSWQLLFFKRFITCSRNCFERLTRLGVSCEKITEIPVLINDQHPSFIGSEVRNVLDQTVRKKFMLSGW